jgi:predicted RNA-binding Zn-ribbon protein involved in translation (DUF1610 family)
MFDHHPMFDQCDHYWSKIRKRPIVLPCSGRVVGMTYLFRCHKCGSFKLIAGPVETETETETEGIFMAVPAEVRTDKIIECSDCGELLPLDVQESAAGYYIGYLCPNCGPYGRSSCYYSTHMAAAEALVLENFGR